jgi:hypothetical protein
MTKGEEIAEKECFCAPTNPEKFKCLPCCIDAAIKEAVKAAEMCDVCAGTGKPISGKPCICGGEGTSTAERVGLRKRIMQLEYALEAVALALCEEKGKEKV